VEIADIVYTEHRKYAKVCIEAPDTVEVLREELVPLNPTRCPCCGQPILSRGKHKCYLPNSH